MEINYTIYKRDLDSDTFLFIVCFEDIYGNLVMIY